METNVCYMGQSSVLKAGPRAMIMIIIKIIKIIRIIMIIKIKIKISM